VANEPVALAVTVATVLYLAAALATAGIKTPGRPRIVTKLAARGRLQRMLAGAAALREDREAKEIVAYARLRALVRGLWISLGVVAALRLLGLGKAGFGILMAAAAAGVLVGIPASGLLVGRNRMAPWLAAGLIMCGAPPPRSPRSRASWRAGSSCSRPSIRSPVRPPCSPRRSAAF
jgi:hypothetical protein